MNTNKILIGILNQTVGQICWNIQYKIINLSFDIGEPKLIFEHDKNDLNKDRKIRKYTRVVGKWFIWVYFADWTLTVIDESGNNKLKAVSSSSNKEKRKVCSLLCGQKLICINIDKKTGKTILLFDLNAKLAIRPRNRNEDTIWLINDPTGCCLSIHGDGTYSYIPSSGLDMRPLLEHVPLKENVAIGLKCNVENATGQKP